MFQPHGDCQHPAAAGDGKFRSRCAGRLHDLISLAVKPTAEIVQRAMNKAAENCHSRSAKPLFGDGKGKNKKIIEFHIIKIRIDLLYKSVVFSKLTSKGITNSLL